MKRQYFIAGNSRIGDCLGMLYAFRQKEEDVEKWVVCNEFNDQVWEFACRQTKLAVAGVKVIQGCEYLMDYNGYKKWIEQKLPKAEVEDGEVITFEPDGNQVFNLNPYLLTPPASGFIHIPGQYICTQMDSMSNWKSIPSIGEVLEGYELPVLSFVHKNERFVPGSIVINNIALLNIYHTIMNSRYFVGICSALTRFAAMLGVPTIMCHFDSRHLVQGVGRADNPQLDLNPLNVDLVKPTGEELKGEIDRLEKEIFFKAKEDD